MSVALMQRLRPFCYILKGDCLAERVINLFRSSVTLIECGLDSFNMTLKNDVLLSKLTVYNRHFTTETGQ